MRTLYLAQVCIGALLLAGTASASVHQGDTTSPATRRAHELAQSQLPKPIPANARLFSNVMLDPARCTYEYVELHGALIVRTELKLTCTTHH